MPAEPDKDGMDNHVGESEPLAEAREAKAVQKDDSRRNKKIASGVAFGIGSAAIVAALLYAGRDKSKGGD